MKEIDETNTLKSKNIIEENEDMPLIKVPEDIRNSLTYTSNKDFKLLLFKLLSLVILLSFSTIMLRINSLSSTVLLIILTSTFSILGLFVYLIKFLDNTGEKEYQTKALDYISSNNGSRIVHGDTTINNQIVPKEIQDLIVKAVYDKLMLEVSVESVEELSKLRDRSIDTGIVSRKQIMLRRIYDEIDSLNKRATANLALGLLMASVGIIVLLIFLLLDSLVKHSTLSEFLISYLPRISIVILIEVFSYFFLRLYKSTLLEIKYFQNEATNIEHKFISLETSLKLDNKELIENSINRFLEIERNPIMNKDEVTREIVSNATLDKESISIDKMTSFINAIMKIKDKS